ncbi:MAG: sensor histidine kinase [Actinomycetota bacterium]|nr:sensor histidine kinase [Actinomycetota bacterium]
MRGPAEIAMLRILTVIGLAQEPTTMAQATDSEQPTTSTSGASAGVADASHRKPLPFAWPLFTAVWLLFPVGFVIQVLQTDLSPVQVLAFLASVLALAGVFLWLMLRYPFPAVELAPQELWIRIGLLLVLAALALYVELVYGSGVPYRFMYVVVAAAVTLPTRKAVWTVVAITVFTGAVYAVQAGWDAFATSWGDIVPFPLIGIGMIAVSRLVVTVRELRAARREIAQLAAAEAVAEERLRFARDLHDLLGHSLSSITLKSELAGRLLPADPEKAAAELHDIEGVARRALREVREAVAGYRQPTLDRELYGAREMLEAAGIACRIENEAGMVPNATDAVLAWAVREGVTNVIRHSRAGHCEIRVTRDGEKIHAEITDDGRGSASEYDSAAAGSGLSGLAERVAASGGDFEARSLPEGGFRLRVSLPLRDGAAPAAESASEASSVGEDGRR